MVIRCVVFVVAIAVAVSLAEGVWSLATGDSLLFPRPLLRMHALDADRIAAAARTPGPFAADEDPRVGFRMKASTTRDLLGVAASMDRYGMRVRLGPDPAADAVRIAILGDSVAFGFGVADDETLGHHLESMLANTVSPRPFVTTVACSGWNFENQARYLRNHLGRIDPDIVVMLPVGNDLDDGFGVDETGQRTWPSGPGDPFVGVEVTTGFFADYVQRTREVGGAFMPWPLVLTDLSPASRARWDGYVAGVRDLAERLAGYGAKFAVAYADRDEFTLVLHERLTAVDDGIVAFGLHGPRGAEDCIPNDPHPNGRWYRESARLIARELIERGWVEGADAARLPEPDARYTDKRHDLATWRVDEATRAAWDAFYGAVFDRAEGQGYWQVYGGVEPDDGTVGMGCRVGLRHDAPRELVAELGLLPADSGVYPVTLTWRCGARVIGTTRLEIADASEGTKSVRLSIPEDMRTEPRVDVTIEPSNWVYTTTAGRARLASVRLERLELR